MKKHIIIAGVPRSGKSMADRADLRRDRGKVFDEIKERKITAEQVEASEFYGKIADRVVRHHGHCCIRKKSGFQRASRLFYMTD